MKQSRSIPLALLAGLLLTVASIGLTGVAAAIAWPSTWWQLGGRPLYGAATQWAPMLALTIPVGVILFRHTGNEAAMLASVLAPHLGLWWLLGAPATPRSWGDIGNLMLGPGAAYVAGVVAAWLWSRRYLPGSAEFLVE